MRVSGTPSLSRLMFCIYIKNTKHTKKTLKEAMTKLFLFKIFTAKLFNKKVPIEKYDAEFVIQT